MASESRPCTTVSHPCSYNLLPDSTADSVVNERRTQFHQTNQHDTQTEMYELLYSLVLSHCNCKIVNFVFKFLKHINAIHVC